MRQCQGCGAVLQTVDSTQPGYVVQSALSRDHPLCRRCFRIRHYGDFGEVSVSPEEYRAEVAKIREKPGRVIYVLDVFDLAGSILSDIAPYFEGSAVDVVVNKIDLLPREVKVHRLETWIRQTVQASGVQVARVFFVSAQSGQGVDAWKAALTQVTEEFVYAVGAANVGKSTLLNRLVPGDLGGTSETFTMSRLPGTTLRMVGQSIQLAGKTKVLFDTPGLVRKERISERLCPNCLAQTVPRARIRPRVFQLRPEQTLFLGGLCRFDFEHGKPQSVVLYVSNELPIHRTKLERADDILTTRQQEVLKIPCRSCQMRALASQPHAFASVGIPAVKGALRIGRRGSDLVLPGLGWICLSGDDVVGRLWTPQGIVPSERRRLIGDVSRPFSTAKTRRRILSTSRTVAERPRWSGR
ncbi:MAG: ribosome biogenesis GTPase YqeH [Alicyclobacillaceae bacterium]|nr:ribosome biogenesis GTPase YqeH [Alicyclobacillaceae bacterium]